MKRAFAAFILLLTVLFAGCGQKDGENITVEAEAAGEKEKLVLAAYMLYDPTLQDMVSAFNAQNEQYNIVIRDISQGDAYSAEEALLKLNTEIVGGNAPDMISFQHLNPWPYIAKDYLVDLSLHFDRLGIDAQQIVAAKALESRDGGIYYLSNSFVFETIVGKHSKFGDRYGWTLQEYLELDAARAEGAHTIYNITAENFLMEVSSRYIPTAVDWENGTCDFNNDTFRQILEASGSIRESSEAENPIFSAGGSPLAEDKLVSSLAWVTNVDGLYQEEYRAGCRLSFFGWPTVDGSCGTDLHLIYPVGVFADGENTEACLAFIKFMLCDYSPELQENIPEYGMPLYMPRLLEKLEQAQTRPAEQRPISSEYAERFLALLSEIENVAIYDSAIVGIINKEAEACFSGDKSADEVLELIQSKAAIYVSEQS